MDHICTYTWGVYVELGRVMQSKEHSLWVFLLMVCIQEVPGMERINFNKPLNLN